MSQFEIGPPNEDRVCQRVGCDKAETQEVMWQMLSPSYPTPGAAMFCDDCGRTVMGAVWMGLSRRLVNAP